MRRCLVNKKILEIGSGTSLPGILASKIGANVILTDNAFLSKSLAHIKRICAFNKLKIPSDIAVKGLSWGELKFINKLKLLNFLYIFLGMIDTTYYDLGNDLDLIIGSDCLYDLSVFEDVISTLSFILDRNPKATAIISYQLRSSDWSIENLLKKYELKCRNIDLESISKDAGIDVKDLMEGHMIYLLEIYKVS